MCFDWLQYVFFKDISHYLRCLLKHYFHPSSFKLKMPINKCLLNEFMLSFTPTYIQDFSDYEHHIITVFNNAFIILVVR